MSFANQEVLNFYRELPFNVLQNEREHRRFIKSGISLRSHPVLAELISEETRVLEVGCGMGRFSAQLADQYDALVTAIDFNPDVIAYAIRSAELLKLRVDYQTSDLFVFEPSERFDVCISLGVLHHTNDCLAAIAHCLNRFLKPGGHFYVGLYHLYGRKPFLVHFKELIKNGAKEEDLFKEYARLDNGKTDPTYLRSWFRDQVLHPHETQHTLKEITEVCAKSGARLVKTSINQFEDFETEAELFEREVEYEQVSRRWLAEGKYFPGFFTALYRKT